MNLSKLNLIIQREYLTRVRTKMFLFTTLLAPFIMIAIITIPALIMIFSTDRERTLLVYDETGVLYEQLEINNPGKYSHDPEATTESLRVRVMESQIAGFIVLREDVLDGNSAPELYHDGSLGFTVTTGIRSDLRNAVRDVKLDRAQAGPEILAILDHSPGLISRTLGAAGDEEQDAGILFGIGYFMAFAIYMALFIYGGIVMRGVIEEKTSRVVEIMTSSVRPIELLTGKVLGIGAVGVTQFLIWIIAGAGLLMLAAPLFMLIDLPAEVASGAEAAQAELPFPIPSIGIEIWGGFLVYFLFGYLIYSALFAAIGSAVESESETQQLMMPVLLLIIIPIMLLGSVANDPSSRLALITSMIPFFSPILMPVRLAIMNVPLWQTLLSILILALTFLLIMWVSSRIYRVGILMYGKKATFREIIKWIRYSG